MTKQQEFTGTPEGSVPQEVRDVADKYIGVRVEMQVLNNEYKEAENLLLTLMAREKVYTAVVLRGDKKYMVFYEPGKPHIKYKSDQLAG